MITMGSIDRVMATEWFEFLSPAFRGRRTAIRELTHGFPEFVFWIYPDGRLHDARKAIALIRPRDSITSLPTNRLRPIVTVLESIQVGSAEGRQEIRDEKILGFLGKSDAKQLEVGGVVSLSHIVREPEVPGETEVEAIDRESVEPTIIQSLHPEGLHGFHLVSFMSQGFDKLPR